MACLHHSSDEERLGFYIESARILKPDGKLVIGEVVKDSLQDQWLNEFVDAHNSLGHKGRFFNNGINGIEKFLLESAGYNVDIHIKEYDWEFKNKDCLIDFSKKLFGLDLANNNTILHGFKQYFDINIDSDPHTTYKVPWKLLYFVASKK